MSRKQRGKFFMISRGKKMFNCLSNVEAVDMCWWPTRSGTILDDSGKQAQLLLTRCNLRPPAVFLSECLGLPRNYLYPCAYINSMCLQHVKQELCNVTGSVWIYLHKIKMIIRLRKDKSQWPPGNSDNHGLLMLRLYLKISSGHPREK